jgi:hypothetical protein
MEQAHRSASSVSLGLSDALPVLQAIAFVPKNSQNLSLEEKMRLELVLSMEKMWCPLR